MEVHFFRTANICHKSIDLLSTNYQILEENYVLFNVAHLKRDDFVLSGDVDDGSHYERFFRLLLKACKIVLIIRIEQLTHSLCSKVPSEIELVPFTCYQHHRYCNQVFPLLQPYFGYINNTHLNTLRFLIEIIHFLEPIPCHDLDSSFKILVLSL